MNEAPIRLHVELLEDGTYLATSPDVPGLLVEARSMTELVEIAQDVTRKLLELCIENGDPIPHALTRYIDNPENIELVIPVSVP